MKYYTYGHYTNDTKKPDSVREKISTAKRKYEYITVDGMVFVSYKEAAVHLGVCPCTVKYRIKTNVPGYVIKLKENK